jgi:hypothetical protein
MENEKRERWKQLCELASTEQNPKKLLELVAEINRLLEEKQVRLSKKEADKDGLP